MIVPPDPNPDDTIEIDTMEIDTTINTDTIEIDSGSGNSICDSLPVPNEVFPYYVGETLIYEDSLGNASDTLHCTFNQAYEIFVQTHMNEFCQGHYEAQFTANWLPLTSKIKFSYVRLPHFIYTLSIYPDFSYLSTSVNSAIYFDTLLINNHEYAQALIFSCDEDFSCTQPIQFCFAGIEGLVAYYRDGKWLTRQD
jgi:hypothetical protein